MRVFSDVTRVCGNTPLVKLNALATGLSATVAVKLESMNPLGSVKDRIAVAMLDEAERQGLIAPGKSTIIEPTSGNTGIGLAFVCASRGYKLVLTMPDTASIERRKLLYALGAEIVLIAGQLGMKGAVKAAEELLAIRTDSYMPQQFNNPANPQVHRQTTAEEIWHDSEGQVDIFISAVGTGGTITGVGQVLKERKPSVKIVAVEPADSPVISQCLSGKPLQPSPHKIQGIGAGFIPAVLDLSVIDEVQTVSNEQAFLWARNLHKAEGIFAGISSGAAVFAALEQAARPENQGKMIVTVLPSTAERYLSTALFADLANATPSPAAV